MNIYVSAGVLKFITLSAMMYADEIRKTILTIAEEHGTENSFEPSDVARKMDKENWRGLLQQVNIVADVLIREGKIIIETSGGTPRFKKI
jgi:hypothetical protein